MNTHNTLPLKVRQAVIALLSPRLADAIDLQLQAKEAHWNVRGPAFIALHELFDKTAEIAEEAADDIAERIVTLGGRAPGAVQRVAKTTSLAPYPSSANTAPRHTEALAAAVADFSGKCRTAIDHATRLGDPLTADLLTATARGLDEQVWFIESHLDR